MYSRKDIRFTPADDVCQRRISEIVRHIGEKSVQFRILLLHNRFNAKENFTRAFGNEQNMRPAAWKTADCRLRLFMPFRLTPPIRLAFCSGGYFEQICGASFGWSEDDGCIENPTDGENFKQIRMFDMFHIQHPARFFCTCMRRWEFFV